MAMRLSNIWLIISGSLSVLGMFAFQSGSLDSDVKPSPSSLVPLSSKQNEEAKLIHEPLNHPPSGKVNMLIFSQDETIEMNPVQKGIHSFAPLQR